MTEYSDELIRRLKSATVTLEPARPTLLLEPGDVERVRDRARSIPGLVDDIAERARAAAKGEAPFHPKVKDSYLFPHLRDILKPLTTAALVLEDERSAMRALEAVETYLSPAL